MMSFESFFIGLWRKFFEIEIFRDIVFVVVVDEVYCVD